MRVTTLIENTSPDTTLYHEHGLSLHLCYEGHSILLDAGATGRFAQNAQALGVDLAGVEAAVLSHGHDDHADGFAAFFPLNSHAPVYARPAITRPYYIPDGQGGEKFIGVNPAVLEQYGNRFVLADGPRQLLPGLHLVPDPVEHEQSLVAETDQGLVIFNSCCHAGADAVVRSVQAPAPWAPPPRRSPPWPFAWVRSWGWQTSTPATAPANPPSPCCSRPSRAGSTPSPPAWSLPFNQIGSPARPLQAEGGPVFSVHS